MNQVRRAPRVRIGVAWHSIRPVRRSFHVKFTRTTYNCSCGMAERESEIHAAFADGYTLDDDLYPEGRQQS